MKSKSNIKTPPPHHSTELYEFALSCGLHPPSALFPSLSLFCSSRNSSNEFGLACGLHPPAVCFPSRALACSSSISSSEAGLATGGGRISFCAAADRKSVV